MRPARWPVRVRLTVLYAGAFLAAGLALVAVTYSLVSRSLLQPVGHRGAMIRIRTDQDVDEAAFEAARRAVEVYRSEVLSSLLTWSLLALGGALVLAVVLGWVLAGRAMRPLRQVTETANRVAGRSLHERIALTGPDDEVKELADTIDAMLERLDRSFDAQRRFVANASHELKTPLAVNRTLLEVALSAPEASDDLKRLAPTLLATNERSERLIDGLLILARSEQEITERVVLDLAEVADVAIEHERPDVRKRGITVCTDLKPAPVRGSPVLIERLAANLVQNAVRHSPQGSQVHVRTKGENEHAVLEVESPGDELRPYEVDQMFEAFRRRDGRVHAERGLGLGLSIVRSIAQAHGGAVSARPRAGGGLVVQVQMPRQEESTPL